MTRAFIRAHVRGCECARVCSITYVMTCVRVRVLVGVRECALLHMFVVNENKYMKPWLHNSLIVV